MPVQATAVLSVEVDSTKVLAQIKKFEEDIKKIPEKIAPVVQLDVAKVKSAVESVKKEIMSINNLKIEPQVKMPQVATGKQQWVENVKLAVRDFEKESGKISGTLKNIASSGEKFYDTAATREFLKKSTQQTKALRSSIKDSFQAISNDVKKFGSELGNVDFSSLQKKVAFLARGTNQQFKMFLGSVPVKQLKTQVQEQEKVLTEFANRFKALSGKQTGFIETESFSRALDKIRAYATSKPIAPVVDTVPFQRALERIKTFVFATNLNVGEGLQKSFAPETIAAKIPADSIWKRISEKIKSGSAQELRGGAALGQEAARRLLGSEFITGFNSYLMGNQFRGRFEFGQFRGGIVAEATAAFSGETIARKMFSSLFGTAKLAGQVGYISGKLLESSAEVFKIFVNGTVGIASSLLQKMVVSLASIFGSKMKNFGNQVAAGIRDSGKIIQYAIAVLTRALQLFLNKYVVSVLLAIQSYMTSIITNTLKKLGSFILSSARSIFNGIKSSLRSLFSVFGGTTGGFLEELGNIPMSTLIGVGGMAAAIKVAGNLEQNMLAVATISGQVGASLDSSTQKVVDLSNEFGKSAMDVSKALYGITTASFFGEEGLTVLRNSITVAKGGMTDMATAGDFLSRTLRAYNMAASEASRVSDIFFNTVKRGITTPQELASQFTRITAISSTVGVSLEEVGALFANLTRNGQLTEQAVTGLTQIFQSIIAPTSQAKDAIAKLGIEWSESAIRAKGFTEIMYKVAPMVLANKEAFQDIVGDVQALKSLLVLAGGIVSMPTGAQSLQTDLEAMMSRGSAAMAAATVAIGFNEQLAKFWNMFLNILRNIGQLLLPVVMPALEGINEFVSRIADFANIDIKNFLQAITAAWDTIKNAFATNLAKMFDYLLEKWDKTKTLLLAGLNGLISAIGPLFASLFVAFVNNLPRILAFIIPGIWSKIIVMIDFLLEILSWTLNEKLGKVFSYIKSIFHFLIDVAEFAINLLVEMFNTALGYIEDIVGLFWDIEEPIQRNAKPKWKEMEEKYDVGKAVMEFSDNFWKGFNEVYANKLNEELTNFTKNIQEPLGEIGQTVVDAGKGLSQFSTKALQDQKKSIQRVIEYLSKDLETELANGDTKRATITKQFLENEKARLATILDQLKTSPIRDAETRKQKLYEGLLKAQKDNDVVAQRLLLGKIRDTELLVVKLQEEAAKKQGNLIQAVAQQQANSFETLKKKAMDLLKATQDAGGGLNKLSEVLDDIFGKDVERIAKKYGVGRDLASLRETSKDVILAKASGFSQKDVDKIVQVGMMEQSDLLTKIFTTIAKSTKSIFNLEDLARMGMLDDIIVFLDRAEKLGMSAQSRLDLFRGKIDLAAFDYLDKQKAVDDKETGLIEQAMNQFKNVEETRKLQERRNSLQDRINSMVKGTILYNTDEKAKVDDLEKTVDQMEILFKAMQKVPGGP